MNQAESGGRCREPSARVVAPLVLGLVLCIGLVSPLVAQELSVEKTGPAMPVGAALNFSYQIFVIVDSLAGEDPDPLAGIRVRDPLPAGVAFVDATGADWECEASGNPVVVTCEYDGELDEGESAPALTLEVTAPMQGGTIFNTAYAESAEDEDDFPWESNEVEVTITPRSDLAIAVDADSQSDAEALYNYEITVENLGPSDATGIEVLGSVPPEAWLESVSGAGWTCQANLLSGAFRCTRAALASGAERVIGVVARAPRNPPSTGEIESGLTTVSSTTPDPQTSNNSAPGAQTAVDPVVSISVEKTSPTSVTTPGEIVSYEIVVANQGPTDAVGDLTPFLNDAFPNQLRSDPAVCENLPTHVPCWECDWIERPRARARLDINEAAALEGVRQLVVSPDNQHVYAAGGGAGNIAVLERNAARGAGFGALTSVSQAAFSEVHTLAFSPTGRVLAAASTNEVRLYSRNPTTGALTQLHAVAGLDDAHELVFGSDGRYLYLADSGADRIAIFAVDELDDPELVPAGSADLDGATALAISPDGAFLFATAPTSGSLVTFAVNAASGALTEVQSAQPMADGLTVALRALAVRADGNELYAAGGGTGSQADALFVFTRDGSGLPDIGNAQVFIHEPAAGRLLYDIRSLTVDPNGLWLTASAAGSDLQNAVIAHFERQTLSDPLMYSVAQRIPAGTPVHPPPQGGEDALVPAGLAVDRNGEHLYLAANNDNPMVPFGSVLLYDTIGAAGCGLLRPGDLESGNIAALPVPVPAGQSVIVSVHSAVNNGVQAGTMTNTATLMDGQDDAIDSDSHEHQILLAANIRVDKRALDEFAQPVPGEPYQYRIQVTNSSGVPVNGLNLTDVFPVFEAGSGDPGFEAGSISWTCSASGSACCNHPGGSCGQASPTPPVAGNIDRLLNLPGQSSITIIATGTLHQDATGTLVNVAQAVMPSGIDAVDPNALISTHEADIQIKADAWIEKSVRGLGEVDDTPFVRYDVLVGNNGPGTLNGVQVQDLFEADGLDGDEAQWLCTVAQGNGCCAYDTVAGECPVDGDSAAGNGPLSMALALQPDAVVWFEIMVPLTTAAEDSVINTATVILPGGVDDPNLANNTSTIDTRLAVTADLAISKDLLLVGDAVPGESVAFEIHVTNEGPDNAFVGVRDLLPPELEQVAWTCDATSPIPGDLTYRAHFAHIEWLLNATSTVVSADGRHVYSAARGGGENGEIPSAVVAFSRDHVPGDFFGTLVVIDVEIDGVNDPNDPGLAVGGIAGASALALSRDQRHLYVAGAGAEAIAVFSRGHIPGTPQFGELSFVQARANGDMGSGDAATISGLGGARSIVVSPDDKHVYVVGEAEDSVVVFNRNSTSGVLGYLGRIRAADLPDLQAMRAPTAIAMDEAGQHFYISARGVPQWFESSTWERVDDHAATGDHAYFVENNGGVASKRFQQLIDVTIPQNSATVELTFQHLHSLDIGPAGECRDVGVLEISRDHGQSWMDVVAAGGVFISGTYNGQQSAESSGDNPLSGRDGWCGASSGSGTDSFTQVAIDLGGALLSGTDTPLRLRWVLGQGSGTHAGETGWWLDEIALIADGEELLHDPVDRNASDSSVVVLARDTDSESPDFGMLQHVQTLQPLVDDGSDPLDGLSGAIAVAIDPAGENVYVAGPLRESLVAFQRTPADGTLLLVQDFRLDAGDAPIPQYALAGVSGLAVSPDGEHVVATGRDADMLLLLRRAPFSGELKAQQVLEHGQPDSNPVAGGLAAPVGAAFSPDGQHIYTAAAGTHNQPPAVGIFNRQAPDPTFGFLQALFDGQPDGYLQNVDGLLGARAVTVSPDGEYVYAVGFGSPSSGVNGSLAVFKRHRDLGDTSGTFGMHLEFVKVLKDGVGGVTGLDGPTDIVMAGDHLYVSSERDNAVAVFAVNGADVTHVQSYFNGSGGIQGLLGASAITASGSGQYIYVAGRFDHSIVVFARNETTGELNFLGRVQNGVGGVQGLEGVSGLAVATGLGDHLYAASRQDHAVAVFSIAANGLLSFRQVVRDGVGGEGLQGAIGVAVTREDGGSEHVLVASPELDSVAVFKRQTDVTLSTYGQLSFVARYRNSDPGIDGLAGARAIAVNRDGTRVYVVGQNDNSLVIFERHSNPTSLTYGQLAPLELRRDGVGVAGLQGPYGIAVSPDDRHIYTAALGSHALAAFIRRSGSSCGTRSGLGNLDEEVFVAAGGSVTFLVEGLVRSGATGLLENEASLVIPPEVTNTCGASCESASSNPTVLVPRSVLNVEKTDNRLSVVAGSRQAYRLTVENEGPSDARGVTITDLLTDNPDLLEETAAWSCYAVGSGLLERRHTASQENLEMDALAGLAGVAWAADPTGEIGERVYVTSVLGNALTGFEFDHDSGLLQVFETMVHGGVDDWGNPLENLRGARGVVATSDGRFVYVTSQIDDAIVVFEVETDIGDPRHGRLRYVESLNHQTPDMSGFDQPQGVTLSADESWLYVASANDDALYVFSRDGTDGTLTFEQRLKNGHNDPDGHPVTGLGGAAAVAASSDGSHVYVASTNDNAVTVFAVDPVSGELTWLQSRSSPSTAGLVGAAAVVLDADGRNVYVAGRDSHSIVVFPRAQDQNHGELAAPIQVLTPATAGLQGLIGPRHLIISPDGEHVYAAAYGTSSVFAFRRDREDGRLEFLGRYRDSTSESGLTGVSSLAQNAAGTYVFSGALLDAAVTSFRRPSDSGCSASSGTGELDLFEVDVAAGGSIIIDLEVDIAAGALGVACPLPLDPERNCVVNAVTADIPNQPAFVSVSDSDASYLTGAAGLTITKTDGLAEFRGLAEARALAVTAEGDGYIYVASQTEPGIGVYRIEPSSGPTGDYPLTFVQLVRSGAGGVSGLNGISDLVLSPDAGGAVHLYATSALDSSVVWFRRDPTTGRLEFARRYNNNTDGIAGISGASAAALSPDQRHLYVAGRTSNSIAIFARQHDSGASDYGSLTFVDMVQSGTGGVEHLIGPVGLTLGAQGNHLYVAATGSSAVVVFHRQHDDTAPGFGGLQFLQARRNGVAGVSGLLNVSQVHLAAGGADLYAVGSGNHSLVHFARNTDSGSGQFGQIQFVARYTQGENGISGLTDVSDITLAAGGTRLYAASPTEHAVAIFERAAGGELTWLGRVANGDIQNGSDPVSIEGLGAARAIAEGPSGQVLVAGAAPGSIAVLEPAGTPPLAFAGSLLQGGGGAAPGDEVTYLITVVNHGPSDVSGARVRDIFPPEFETVSWACFAEGTGSQCVNAGEGNIDTLVNIVAGGRVTFEATGLLRPDVSGMLVNTATVTLPAESGGGAGPVHSEAVDDDTVLNHLADVAIEIEDLPATLVAGEEVNYLLRVSNHGPSEARNSYVRHVLPELFGQVEWECVASREPGLLGLVESDPGDLLGYSDAAISPDGRHVYTLGPEEEFGLGSIHVLRRNTLTGTLSPIQTLRNGQDNVDGLAGGIHVVMSSDGRHVYVAGRADDAIAVFERDHDQGHLTFIQVLRDNIGVVDGLGGVSYLALSPNNAQLYAVGTLDNAIAVFDRDPLSGALNFAQIVRNGIDDVVGLVLPRALAIAPSGQYLYVAATGSDTIVRLARAGNGQLTFVDRIFQGQQQLIDGQLVTVDGLAGVRSLAFAGPNHLYTVASDADSHALTLLSPDANGALFFAGLLRDGDSIGVPSMPISGLTGASAITVTPDARQLYVAGTDTGGMRTLTALRIVEGLDLQFLQTIQGSAAGNPDDPQRLLISGDNRHLYSSGGEAALDVYALQRGSVCGRAGTGGIFDVIDLESGGDVEYRITGRVQANARGSVSGLASVFSAPGVRDLHMDNNVAEFTVDVAAHAAVEVTKTLLTDEVVAGLPVAWQVTVENHGPSTVRAISINDELPALPGQVPAPGAPGIIAGSAEWVCESQPNVAITQYIQDAELAGVNGLAYSADGRWMFAAAADTDSISVYERVDPFGWLELRDRVVDGTPILDPDGEPVGQVTGLQGATAVAVAAGHNHVYVGSRQANAIAVFELNADDGTLQFIESRHDSEFNVSGLKGPSGMTLSPDGLYLYVAARDDNAISVFARNPASGRLQWLQTVRQGQGSVPLNTLSAVRTVRLSPDGAFLYAAGTQSHTLVVFRRDLFSGSLSFVQRVANGDIQGTPEDPIMVSGLQLVRDIELSPQGGQLYAASLADNSVTYFLRDAVSGELSFQRTHVNGQNGIQGLDGSVGVALGPDGERLYAAALNSGNLVVLDRDWDSGHLSYLELQPVGESTMASPQFIAISPDGQQIAVSSNEQGGAITVMRQLPEGYCGLQTLAADDLNDVIDLAAGGSLTYSVQAMVHPGARGELVNTAQAVLPPGITPLTPSAHVGSVGEDIKVITQLSIVKEASESTLVAGLPAEYTLVVANDGPSHALGAQVIDLFSSQVAQAVWFCEASGLSGCTAEATGDVTDTVSLLVGDVLVYDIEVLVDPGAAGELTNTASVEAPADGSDPETEDNVSSVTSAIVRVADVRVNKSVNPTQAQPGDPVSYLIRVDNAGPSDAAMVTLIDMLPDELIHAQWTCEGEFGAQCPDMSGSGEVWLEGLLVAGGRWSVVVDAEVSPDAALGAVVNTATITVAVPVTDPQPGNNHASAVLLITDAPDIEIIFHDRFEVQP